MTFDDSLDTTLGFEGGYSDSPTDRGGPTINGISSASWPADFQAVKNLTDSGQTDQAAQYTRDFYKKNFWQPIGGDSLPPDVAHVAFDTAVNNGVGTAKQLLAQSKGDPQTMLQLKQQHDEQIAQNDPTQAANLPGWTARNAALGTKVASASNVLSDADDPMGINGTGAAASPANNPSAGVSYADADDPMGINPKTSSGMLAQLGRSGVGMPAGWGPVISDPKIGDTLYQGAKQGFGWGWTDEAQALAAQAAAPSTPGVYTEAEKEYQQEIEAAKQRDPEMYNAGMMGGGALTGKSVFNAIKALGGGALGQILPEAISGAGVEAGAAPTIADVGRSALGNAGASTALAALAGAGQGTTPESRLANATNLPMLGGAALLGTIPDAVEGGSAALKALAKTMNPAPLEASEFIAGHLNSRPDMQDALENYNTNALQAARAGIPATLGENLEDPSIIKQQTVAAGEPGSMGKMQAFNDARDQLIPQKLQQVAASLGPAGDNDEAAQQLVAAGKSAAQQITAQLSAKAQPLYEQAFGANQSMISPEINRILDTPSGKEAMKRAVGLMQNNGVNVAVSDPALTEQAAESGIKTGAGVARGLKMQTLDYVKKAFDDMYGEEVSTVNPGMPVPNKARTILSLKNSLLDEMDSMDATKMGNNPGAYAQARGIYSGQPDMLTMRERMGGLAGLNNDKPGNVARAMQGMGNTAATQTATALGPKAGLVPQSLIYNALENSNEATGAYGVPGKIYNTPAKRELLSNFLPEDKMSDVEDTMDTINRANTRFHNRGNSVTAPLEQAQQNAEAAAATSGKFMSTLKAISAAAHGDLPGVGMNAMDLVESKKGLSPNFYNDMADLMTTDKGAQLIETLKNNPDAFERPGFQRLFQQEIGKSLNKPKLSVMKALTGYAAGGN